MLKFLKGHNSGKTDRICSKVNQLIFSSSSISWLSFKPLAQILFMKSCWQDFILIFSKWHNFRKGENSEKKKVWISYFSMRNPYVKFQNPSILVYKTWHASKSNEVRGHKNHWTMKYRSQWPTFILRSNVRSCWLTLPKYDVHTSNTINSLLFVKTLFSLIFANLIPR